VKNSTTLNQIITTFVYFIPLTVNLTKNSKLEKFVHELNALWKLAGGSMGALRELVAVGGIKYYLYNALPPCLPAALNYYGYFLLPNVVQVGFNSKNQPNAVGLYPSWPSPSPSSPLSPSSLLSPSSPSFRSLFVPLPCRKQSRPIPPHFILSCQQVLAPHCNF
jgi:hypothetical protein